MSEYAVIRRATWATPEPAIETLATARRLPATIVDDARYLDGYVLEERRGLFGVICILEADGPEAVRQFASRSGLGIGEIALVVQAKQALPEPNR